MDINYMKPPKIIKKRSIFWNTILDTLPVRANYTGIPPPFYAGLTARNRYADNHYPKAMHWDNVFRPQLT